MSFEDKDTNVIMLDSKYCKCLLPVREEDFSKSDCGNILIIAGLSGMVGAAYMASFSALRSGAGLVRVLTSDLGTIPMQCLLPEAICVSEVEGFCNLVSFVCISIGAGMCVSV